MLNKKIIAATVAAFFAANVNAAAVYPELEVAQESLPALVDGMYDLDPGTVSNDLGFSIANTTSKYVRYDLVNAEFDTIASLAVPTSTNTTSTGGDGETFVIFEVSASADIAQSAAVVLDSTYKASGTSKAQITYGLYETAGEAVSKTNPLSTDTGDLAEVGAAMTEGSIDDADLEALVADAFTKFTGSSATGSLGFVDVADALATGFVKPDAATFNAAEIVTTSATVTFTGDFSFGEWTYNTASWETDEDGDIVQTAGTVTVNDNGTVTVDYNATSTLDVDTTLTSGFATALKGSYSVALEDVTFGSGSAAEYSDSGSIGEITYDTTSVEMPYVTTFSGYNQRIIINNQGADANYTISFETEDGVTPTAGTAATGTIAGGELTVIRVADFVSFGTATRGAATMEIEAQAGDITATSQTVNRSTGGTDTTTLVVQ